MQAFPKPELDIANRVLNFRRILPSTFLFLFLPFSKLMCKKQLSLASSVENVQYSALYTSGFIWLLQGHLPTVGLNNRQGTPRGAKKKLLNLLAFVSFSFYVPKIYNDKKMQKSCTNKCFVLVLYPQSNSVLLSSEIMLKVKMGRAKRASARCSLRSQNANIFSSYLEFLNFFRFGDFPFGNAGVEK